MRALFSLSFPSASRAQDVALGLCLNSDWAALRVLVALAGFLVFYGLFESLVELVVPLVWARDPVQDEEHRGPVGLRDFLRAVEGVPHNAAPRHGRAYTTHRGFYFS